MIFLYNISITIYGWLLRLAALWHPKARLWHKGRVGIFSTIETTLAQLPKGRPRVWMHVASLGEFEQGRPLIEALRARHGDSIAIILTFFSPSGYEMRRNYAQADAIFYLPLDTAAHAKRFLALVAPQVAVFVKYEFWYHYLHQLHRNAIPTLLVSALFRDQQLATRQPYARLLKTTLAYFSHIFVQNKASAERLHQNGLHAVSVVGDTRIDRVLAIAAENRPLPIIEAFAGRSKLLICGSTWPKDEAVVQAWWSEAAPRDWKIVIAPHEVTDSHIRQIEAQFPNQTIRYSQWTAGSHAPILIIDNIGMLSALYRYGHVAYIGGGFGKGIHNTLEPIAFQLPVIFGPKYQKFEEAVQLVAQGGGFSVADAAHFKAKIALLEDPTHYEQAAAAATAYVQDQKGATQQILPFLEANLAL